jgi:N-acetylmuramoyl-L-alanine amidase
MIEVLENDDWSYVLAGETYGFIKSQYLSDHELTIAELNRWGIEFNTDEKDLLAQILWLEARGESQTGREAVVEVIFNRMISGDFGSDVYSVLSSPGQFTSWKNRNSATPTVDEYQAIESVLNGGTYIMNTDYVYFSTGKTSGKDFFQIGNHWFGRK